MHVLGHVKPPGLGTLDDRCCAYPVDLSGATECVGPGARRLQRAARNAAEDCGSRELWQRRLVAEPDSETPIQRSHLACEYPPEPRADEPRCSVLLPVS